LFLHNPVARLLLLSFNSLDLYCSIAAAANSRLNYIIEVDFPAQKLLIKLQFTIPSQVPEMFDPDFGNITIYVV